MPDLTRNTPTFLERYGIQLDPSKPLFTRTEAQALLAKFEAALPAVRRWTVAMKHARLTQLEETQRAYRYGGPYHG
jgi:hypothetical protein